MVAKCLSKAPCKTLILQCITIILRRVRVVGIDRLVFAIQLDKTLIADHESPPLELISERVTRDKCELPQWMMGHKSFQ